MSDASGGGSAPNYAYVVYFQIACEEDQTSATRLRRDIEEIAQGSAERRMAAINFVYDPSGEEPLEYGTKRLETPLKAAIRHGRGDLVGLLVELGASTDRVHDSRYVTPLALCCEFGQVESVRALLAAGHDANERTHVFYKEATRYRKERNHFATAVHARLAPISPDKYRSQAKTAPWHWGPQLECLEVLVREGKANVNAPDADGETPLHYVAHMKSSHLPALELLLRLGADVHACSWHDTPHAPRR